MTSKHFELDLHQLGVAKIIKRNYTSLYETAGQYAECPMVIGDKFSWVNNDHIWPNRLYGLNVSEEEVDDVLEKVVSGMRSGEYPEVLTTSMYTRPVNFEPYFEKHGLVKLFDAAGMAVDLEMGLKEGFEPGIDLEISRVTEKEEIREWCSIVMEALFHRPASMMTPYHKAISSLVDNGSIHCFIGRHQGKAVSTSMLFISDKDVAGIYHVSTLEGYRGYNIGKCITLAPLQFAREQGCRVGVLFATHQGEFIYRKLGFEAYCRFGRYTISDK